MESYVIIYLFLKRDTSDTSNNMQFRKIRENLDGLPQGFVRYYGYDPSP